MLAGAIQGIFVLAFVAAAIGLAVTMLAPGGRIVQLAARRGQSEAEKALRPSSHENLSLRQALLA